MKNLCTNCAHRALCKSHGVNMETDCDFAVITHSEEREKPVEPLVFTRPKRNACGRLGGQVKIQEEAWKILTEISNEIGRTASYVASAMIVYAKDFIKIEEDE